MTQERIKLLVVGFVGHLPPEFLADFKTYIKSYPNFRLIRFQESDNKLWLVEREGME